MYSRMCSRRGCSCLLPYDGFGQGIFAFSSRVAIQESMLIEAMVQLSQGSTFDSVATLWQSKHHFHKRDIASELLPQRWLVRVLVRAYLKIIPDVDVICPCCGLSPYTLIADGTALGCLLMLGKKHLQDDMRVSAKDSLATMCGAPPASFHFICDSTGGRTFRALLNRFVLPPGLADGRGPPGGLPVDPQKRGVTRSELQSLIAWLKAPAGKPREVAARLKCLGDVIEYVGNLAPTLSGGLVECPQAWAHLLQPLVVPSTSWMCFAPTEQCEILRELKDANAIAIGIKTSAAELRNRASMFCPFVVDFLDANSLTGFPTETHGLVDQLCLMATAFARHANEPRYVVPAISDAQKTLPQLLEELARLEAAAVSDSLAAAAAPSPQVQGTATTATALKSRAKCDIARTSIEQLVRSSDFEKTSLESDRARGIWASPAYRVQRSQLLPHLCKDTRCDLCSKGAPTSAAFTPGLLVLACPHGYIYYMQFMRGGESPGMVLDFLRDRCTPTTLPVRICYDNGCNLHAYVAARCPDIASRVQFIIDRLHMRNHVHCSIAYQLDRSTHHTPALNFNTQRVEQLNRMLRRLATHLRFSKPQNGIDTLRVFMMVFAYRREMDANSGQGIDTMSTGNVVDNDAEEIASPSEDLLNLQLVEQALDTITDPAAQQQVIQGLEAVMSGY